MCFRVTYALHGFKKISSFGASPSMFVLPTAGKVGEVPPVPVLSVIAQHIQQANVHDGGPPGGSQCSLPRVRQSYTQAQPSCASRS